MNKFGSTRAQIPQFTQIINDIYLYTHPAPLVSVTMDPNGSLLANGEYIHVNNQLMRGYTILSHDMRNGKLLLRKDNI